MTVPLLQIKILEILNILKQQKLKIRRDKEVINVYIS